MPKSSKRYRYTILLGALLLLVVCILYFEKLNPGELDHQLHVGNALQPFAISVGAVITAIGGFSLIEDWLTKRAKSVEMIEYWKKLYPLDKLGRDNGFEFILKANSDHIFVHDKKNGYKRHIANLETLRKVWYPDTAIKVTADEDFDKIKVADSIDIKTS
jgi:hypothetical protein